MKKFVAILLIVSFGFTFGLFYDDAGNFVGVKNTARKALDKLMLLPNFVSDTAVLFGLIEPLPPLELPESELLDPSGNPIYDIAMPFSFANDSYTAYLSYRDGERGLLEDRHYFAVMANSWDPSLNNSVIMLSAKKKANDDGSHDLATYWLKLDSGELVYIDRSFVIPASMYDPESNPGWRGGR